MPTIEWIGFHDVDISKIRNPDSSGAGEPYENTILCSVLSMSFQSELLMYHISAQLSFELLYTT